MVGRADQDRGRGVSIRQLEELRECDWWGGGYYHWYYNEFRRLRGTVISRSFYDPGEAPRHGWLYIRLNGDALQPGVDHHDDPGFWASKIAHEVLHNLAYWHPGYKNPGDRDANNPPGKKAFIVAYEDAIFSAASGEER